MGCATFRWSGIDSTIFATRPGGLAPVNDPAGAGITCARNDLPPLTGVVLRVAGGDVLPADESSPESSPPVRAAAPIPTPAPRTSTRTGSRIHEDVRRRRT